MINLIVLLATLFWLDADGHCRKHYHIAEVSVWGKNDKEYSAEIALSMNIECYKMPCHRCRPVFGTHPIQKYHNVARPIWFGCNTSGGMPARRRGRFAAPKAPINKSIKPTKNVPITIFRL